MQITSCKCNVYQKSATQATERHRHTHAENIMQMQCVSKVCDASDGAPQTYTCRKHHANAMCVKSLRHKQRCATDRHMQNASCKFNVYQKSATQATVRHRQTHADITSCNEALRIKSLRHKQRYATDRHMQKASCKYNVYQKSATQATVRHRQTHVDNIMQIQCVSEVCDASDGAPQTYTSCKCNVYQKSAT
jgi:hypothetical protein